MKLRLWRRCTSSSGFCCLQVLYLFWRRGRFFHLGKLRRWLNCSFFRAQFRRGLGFRFWFWLRARFWFRLRCGLGFRFRRRFRFRFRLWAICIGDIFQALRSALNDEAYTYQSDSCTDDSQAAAAGGLDVTGRIIFHGSRCCCFFFAFRIFRHRLRYWVLFRLQCGLFRLFWWAVLWFGFRLRIRFRVRRGGRGLVLSRRLVYETAALLALAPGRVLLRCGFRSRLRSRSWFRLRLRLGSWFRLG